MRSAVREKRKSRVERWFFICPARHIAVLLFVGVTALYYTLRTNRAVAQFFVDKVAIPYHRIAGRVFSIFTFSVAEWLYAIVIIVAIVYIIYCVIVIIRRNNKLKQLYITIISLAVAALGIYVGACLLWGVCYYGAGFSDKSGLAAAPVDAESLAEVTMYFAVTANDYADKVSRDENGLFNEDEKAYFDAGAGLYENVSSIYPFLDGAELRPKPMVFSKVLSYMNFTGFFFAFTGEANLNTDSSACLIPATIAHEIAHQRGIASEDEANFVGILAAMESGDEVYIYSAALLAYTYLGNALHAVDYDGWFEVYERLPETVRADLRSVNDYWDNYRTKVADASEAVYSGFLQGQGQELGIRSYGACVDLLVAYYGNAE